MLKSDLEETLSYPKWHFKLIGLWPENPPSLVQKYVGILLTVGYLAAMVYASFGLFYNTGMESIALSACCIIDGVQGIIKLMWMVLYKSKCLEILRQLNSSLFIPRTKRLMVCMNKRLRVCRITIKLYYYSCYVLGTLILLTPVFEVESGRMLPIALPLDMKQQPLISRILWWCIAIVATASTALVITVFDTLIFILMTVAAAELEVLRVEIAHDVNDSDGQTKHSLVLENFKRCVIKHLAIERYIASIEETFSLVFLVQTVEGIIMASIQIFACVLMPIRSIGFFRCFTFFMTEVAELALYCIAANEIAYQSEKIREACYMSKWYNYETSARKYLFIIMERSKCPFVLTAGKFVPLSLGTLMTILKTAFSYFTVFWQMFSDRSE